jgi:hypothetical protein
METLPKLRLQNSVYPLHGCVFVGCGGRLAVADTRSVAFVDVLDLGKPVIPISDAEEVTEDEEAAALPVAVELEKMRVESK